MAEHSQGDWTAHRNKPQQEWAYWIDAKNDPAFISIAAGPNQEGNKNLVLAAPALLIACRHLVEWFDAVPQNYQKMLKPFEEAKAAVQKAQPVEDYTEKIDKGATDGSKETPAG